MCWLVSLLESMHTKWEWTRYGIWSVYWILLLSRLHVTTEFLHKHNKYWYLFFQTFWNHIWIVYLLPFFLYTTKKVFYDSDMRHAVVQLVQWGSRHLRYKTSLWRRKVNIIIRYEIKSKEFKLQEPLFLLYALWTSRC